VLQLASRLNLKYLRRFIFLLFLPHFCCHWDAPGAITLNVVSMEREFDAYKLSRCMYASTFNSFPVIRTASAKNRCFHVPQPTFLFPLETPLRLSRNKLYGWKNSMLAKPLTACAHLTITVSEIERDICEKNRNFIIPPCIRRPC